MYIGVLDSYGYHQPSHEQHAGGLEVVNTHLGVQGHWSQLVLFQIYLSCCHDAEEGKEHHWDEGGGRDGQELQQPDGGVRDVQMRTHRILTSRSPSEREHRDIVTLSLARGLEEVRRGQGTRMSGSLST